MFADLARDWSAVLEVLSPPRWTGRDAAATVIADYLSDLAAQLREHPADDLVSAMAAADGGDKLTADEVVTMAALLLKGRFRDHRRAAVQRTWSRCSPT